MSAWMFPDEAIHRLVVALRVDRFFFDRNVHELGAELIMMNAAALAARYGERNRRNSQYTHQRPAAFHVVQAYKSVRCYLYQCSEGDVPTTWPLYRQVEQVRDFYAELLGHDLKADRWDNPGNAQRYNEAEWG